MISTGALMVIHYKHGQMWSVLLYDNFSSKGLSLLNMPCTEMELHFSWPKSGHYRQAFTENVRIYNIYGQSEPIL